MDNVAIRKNERVTAPKAELHEKPPACIGQEVRLGASDGVDVANGPAPVPVQECKGVVVQIVVGAKLVKKVVGRHVGVWLNLQKPV